MQRTLTASQLCSVDSSSFYVTPFQLWPSRPNSSQTISALLIKVVPSLPTSAQLFSLLPCSCQLFSTTLTSAHLVLTLLNSSQLRSTHITSFSAHLNSSHLLNSGQLFSTLLTSCHGAAYTYTQSKLLHGEAFTHSKLLHTESLTHSKPLHREAFYTDTKQAFAQRIFYTQQAFIQRSCYTGCAKNEKYLLHPAAKDIKSILHAAAAARNLDAAIPLRPAETELQNTIELRTIATQIAAPRPDLDAQAEKRRFWSTFEKEF